MTSPLPSERLLSYSSSLGYITPDDLKTNYVTLYFQHKSTLDSYKANGTPPPLISLLTSSFLDTARPLVVCRANEFRWVCKAGFTQNVEEIIMQNYVISLATS